MGDTMNWFYKCQSITLQAKKQVQDHNSASNQHSEISKVLLIPLLTVRDEPTSITSAFIYLNMHQPNLYIDTISTI